MLGSELRPFAFVNHVPVHTECYFVDAREDVFLAPHEFLRLDDDELIYAVYHDGRQLLCKGYTPWMVTDDARIGLLREITEAEAISRLAPRRDRPSTPSDPW